jgi:hypothetical protein
MSPTDTLAPQPPPPPFASASFDEDETVVASGPLGSWLFDTGAWDD